MIAVVQRVSSASVTVSGRLNGSIEQGLVVLASVQKDDTAADAEWMASKLATLRIFRRQGEQDRERR